MDRRLREQMEALNLGWDDQATGAVLNKNTDRIASASYQRPRVQRGSVNNGLRSRSPDMLDLMDQSIQAEVMHSPDQPSARSVGKTGVKSAVNRTSGGPLLRKAAW